MIPKPMLHVLCFYYSSTFFLHNKLHQLLVAEKTNMHLAHNSMGHQLGLEATRSSFFLYWMCFLMHLWSDASHQAISAFQGWLPVGLGHGPYALQYVAGYSRNNNKEALSNLCSFAMFDVMAHCPKGQDKLHGHF